MHLVMRTSTMECAALKTRRKTRRGKKKSHKDLIPSPNVSPTKQNEEVTRSKGDDRRLCGCVCSGDESRIPNLSTTPKMKISNKKRFLRPSAPKAPPNSTQFIMDSYMDDWDLSLYLDNQTLTSSIIPNTSSPSRTGANRHNTDFEPYFPEEDMESYLLRDFESVFGASERELDGKSLSPYSNHSESDYENDTNANTPVKSESNTSVPTGDSQFRSWPNQVLINSSPECAEGISKNSQSPVEAFLSFMSREFENELQKSKEEALYNKRVNELRDSIVDMKKRIESHSMLESLQAELNCLKQENRSLKRENQSLKMAK